MRSSSRLSSAPMRSATFCSCAAISGASRSSSAAPSCVSCSACVRRSLGERDRAMSRRDFQPVEHIDQPRPLDRQHLGYPRLHDPGVGSHDLHDRELGRRDVGILEGPLEVLKDPNLGAADHVADEVVEPAQTDLRPARDVAPACRTPPARWLSLPAGVGVAPVTGFRPTCARVHLCVRWLAADAGSVTFPSVMIENPLHRARPGSADFSI